MGSLEQLREVNRLRVVEALRREPSASRADLARVTGLSRTTVATLVADLQARGLVVEAGGAIRAGRGRPPARLRLDPSVGTALGIAFTPDRIRVVAADLASTILAERDAPLVGAAALDDAAALAADALAAAGVSRCDVVGAGVAFPGLVADGVVRASVVIPGWNGVPLAAELSERLRVRASLENAANLAALAEASYGAGAGLSDFLYVKASTGIAAGLVLGGRLHRGVAGAAGSLGHVQVRPDGVMCRCGNRGCLETVAGVPALLAALRPLHGPELDTAGMLALVAERDTGARRVVKDAARAIGRALADACNHLNPEAVIVGGELAAVGEPFLHWLRVALEHWAQPAAAEAVAVLPAELGDRAEALGAVSLAIRAG